MTLFNHAYTIAFSVDTDHEPDRVTADELKAGLARRLADLLTGPSDEIVEACGAPFDSSENVHMLYSPPTLPYHVWKLLGQPTGHFGSWMRPEFDRFFRHCHHRTWKNANEYQEFSRTSQNDGSFMHWLRERHNV